MDDHLVEIGRFPYREDLRQRWKNEQLYEEWAKKYPFIFDSDDLRQARSQGSRGYHFYEWLAAILLHNSIGYLALVSKYEFGNHRRKQEIVKLLFPAGLPSIDRKGLEIGNTQFPDLLLFAQDYSDWLFCEVKGPNDRISSRQNILFRELWRKTGKPVSVIRFRILTPQYSVEENA